MLAAPQNAILPKKDKKVKALLKKTKELKDEMG